MPLVRLAYIDETYTKEQFWIVALVIPDIAAKALERLMDEVVAVVSETFPEVDPSTELHGYDLDGGYKGWAPLKDMHQARAGIFKVAIEELCKIPNIMLVRGCVNLQLVSWSDSHDPHDWALKFVFEQIDRAFSDNDLVVAICDDVGQREKYRGKFRKFKIEGTGGTRPRKLESFIDALHFVPSHHRLSSGSRSGRVCVQACDGRASGQRKAPQTVHGPLEHYGRQPRSPRESVALAEIALDAQHPRTRGGRG